MAKSFLPTIFEHPYEIDPKYGKSVAYFSMEYAIDNSFKIYSGGLGYLSGSHMRSAHDLRQNLVGVGILWSYGYYNQIRSEDGSMATQYMRKNYPFLEDHNIKFLIHVCGAPVWVKAYFLNPETFGTAPMFFLSTDLEEMMRKAAISPAACTTPTDSPASPSTCCWAREAPVFLTNWALNRKSTI